MTGMPEPIVEATDLRKSFDANAVLKRLADEIRERLHREGGRWLT